MKKNLIILAFCALFLAVKSQIRSRNFVQHEIGIFGGASYYLGDINPRTHFVYSRPAAGIFYRYSPGKRTAFRFGLNYGSVWGSDKKSSDPFQRERNLDFKTDIYEGHVLAEFNFVDYRIGSNNDYFTMFLFAGMGVYHFDPQTSKGVALSTYHTEGQRYSRVQVCLPFGVGIKWNATKIFGFSFEWGPRKLFTDYLDDISSAYPNNPNIYSGTGQPQTMRGNPRSKDWYFYYGFTLQMRLPKKNVECNMWGTR